MSHHDFFVLFFKPLSVSKNKNLIRLNSNKIKKE